jgi:hypothetical protein
MMKPEEFKGIRRLLVDMPRGLPVWMRVAIGNVAEGSVFVSREGSWLVQRHVKLTQIGDLLTVTYEPLPRRRREGYVPLQPDALEFAVVRRETEALYVTNSPQARLVFTVPATCLFHVR